MSGTRADLQNIFRDLFEDDSIVLTDQTTAMDIKGWDSLNNVKLIVQIERKFGVRFSNSEVVSIGNVGELLMLIDKKRGSA
jgi:acyl carrier protein